jgi:hypothetical protein
MIGSSRTKDAFPVNSYVLYKPPDGSRTKMQLPRAGPFIVVGTVGDKYSIQDLLTHKVIDTHVSNLIEFRYDSDLPKHCVLWKLRHATQGNSS